ncbi:hypothetical protein IWQ61_006503 [Dispira simplex]|nr:hypothetical protein IWQ61_006503 [Dispira simplex]
METPEPSSHHPSGVSTFSLEFSDLFVLALVLGVAGLYLFRKAPAKQEHYNPFDNFKEKLNESTAGAPLIKPKATKDRDFIKKIRNNHQRVVFFYGSQTGTAEDLATRLAKEASQRFGIKCLVTDIEDCDMALLNQLPANHLTVFLMATYGEGEPTDNAIDFWEYLTNGDAEDEGFIPEFSDLTQIGDVAEGLQVADQEKPLEHLRFAMFGLGNSTYERYNHVCRALDRHLQRLGGQRVYVRGEGDDDGNLEEDFLAWKDSFWPHFCEHLGVNFAEASARPQAASFTVTEVPSDEVVSQNVFRGLLSNPRTGRGVVPTYDAKNPYVAPMAEIRQLFQDTTDRACYHVEIDISGAPSMSYSTGDHIAVWPVNPEVEVERLLGVLGLANKADAVINVESLDEISGKKLPFPVPTTYRTVLRHSLDIVSPPSRQFFETLVAYAKSDVAKQWLDNMASDKVAYAQQVHDVRLTVGEVLALVQSQESAQGIASEERYTIPFALLLDEFTRILPRYYSISSSSLLSPDKVHLTAVVLRYQPRPTLDRKVYGVCTNYFQAIHQYTSRDLLLDPNEDPSTVFGDYPYLLRPDAATGEFEFATFIRRSNFKLPPSPSTPIIMIGPGTGVAPFRGFVMERAHVAQTNPEEKIGATLLFYGCRSQSQDFLYADEWPQYFKHLPAPSQILCAFSRDQPHKVYVQHLLKQQQELVWKLLSEENAYIYICGDARHMARDVNRVFVEIAAEVGGLEAQPAVNYVKNLRGQGRYQEDVWS